MPDETLGGALGELSAEAAAAGRLPLVTEVARSAHLRRRRAVGAFGVAAMVTAAAVAAVWPGGGDVRGPVPPADEGQGTANEGTPLSFYPAGVQVPADAVLMGTLTLIDDCLLVARGSGELVVPVFPEASATWGGRTLTIGEEQYEVGVSVGFGGGMNPDASLDVTIPSSCPADVPLWLVG